MISKNFSIYTKKQKILLNILDVVQTTLGLVMTGFIVMAMFFTQSSLNIWTIIMGIAAIISLVDIVIRKAFNKRSIFHYLLLKLFKSNNELFSPTPMQNEVNSWVTSRIQNGNGILIYGKPDIGKTSSVFMFLLKETKNIELLRNISWSKCIIYIDCKNNKSDVLDFFNSENENVNKKIYENALIIVDNLESMGKTFLENIISIIDSSSGKFILLSDVGSLDNNLYNTLEKKCMQSNFTLSINGYKSYDFNNIYKKLTDNEKEVLLVIYYISLSLTLIQVRDIYSIFKKNISMLQLKFIISSLLRKGVIKYFPFDHTYILFVKRVDMAEYYKVIWETQQNLNAVNKMLLNSEKFPESAWLSILRLPYDKITKTQIEDKEKIFDAALKIGNYDTLYKALSNELNYSSFKENIFLYESATLYFYNSEQDKAFKKYNILINQADSIDKKNLIMLKIIEATHGDVSSATQQNIRLYLNDLLNDEYEYQLYAKYWMLHMKTEKGDFLLKEYETLLRNLTTNKNNILQQQLYLEIVKRCYTDIIRSYHILKKLLPSFIIADFDKFLNENYIENPSMINYYNSLYVKANTLHYIELINDILEYKSCQETYDCAVIEYNKAIASGYENHKSVNACELKYIDLKLYLSDNILKFQEYETKIKTFLSNAEINRVSVHVAYCKTLLSKLYMVQNLYYPEYYMDSNNTMKDACIKKCLCDARKIYKDYQNEYGVIRIDMLKLLYKITRIKDRNELHNILKKMADILKNHQEYQREIDIIQFYQKIFNKNESFGMLAISILKAYPIIMQ